MSAKEAPGTRAGTGEGKRGPERGQGTKEGLEKEQGPGGTKEWPRTGARECRAFSLFGASFAKFASVIK